MPHTDFRQTLNDGDSVNGEIVSTKLNDRRFVLGHRWRNETCLKGDFKGEEYSVNVGRNSQCRRRLSEGRSVRDRRSSDREGDLRVE